MNMLSPRMRGFILCEALYFDLEKGKKNAPNGAKRPTGIEPASSAWKAEVIAIIPQSHYVRDTR